jgi:ABC-type hemin transport system substrate-binding protein
MPQVVSLAPMASESLVLMGWEAALIAVDSESARLVELADLPRVDLAPDVVIVSTLAEEDRPIAAALRARGGDVVEFAPHDFDDVYALWRALGIRLGRENAAHRAVRDHSRELAAMSAGAYGYQRPRVAAVVGLTPLEVAGGHSFTTDLIEIAGAESVTHGSEERRIAMTPGELRATAPDLVIVIQATRLSAEMQRSIRERLGDSLEIAFLTFDRQRFWLRHAVETARIVRDPIQPLVAGRLLPAAAESR